MGEHGLARTGIKPWVAGVHHQVNQNQISGAAGNGSEPEKRIAGGGHEARRDQPAKCEEPKLKKQAEETSLKKFRSEGVR